MIEAPVVTGAAEPEAVIDESPSVGARPARTVYQTARRRFAWAVTIGTAIVSVPYLWVLWDLWTGSVSGLRSVAPDNFYELQARGMFAGHLWVPNGTLGIEGFLHGGHTFTYFGLWPSLIRMPILAVTHAYDGRLTAPSLLLAWLLTGLFTSLLIWRLRFLLRGAVAMGRAEAASYGALMAAILGGSVLIFIAANPSTYDEDFAWSVALVVGSLFTLLGVLERPTGKGVLATGLLVLAANLNRSPTGYACVIVVLLVAGWFAIGRAGRDQRKWAVWLAMAGIVPLLANCAVTYAKFGLPFGLPMADQVWAHINAHRRYFLAANGGKAFSLSFIPSTVWAYLDPTAIRFSSLFPFISAPPTPAHAVTNVVLDQTYATTSVTASSPLLFLLGCWGLVTAFRPRGIGKAYLTRFILIGGAVATGGVLVWGYIAYRYVSDLMPFLIVASAIGLIDIWRRLDGRQTLTRRWAFGFIVVLAAVGVAANVAITAAPSTWFSQTQLANFVGEQLSTSPTSLSHTVVQGDRLPYYAPSGHLFIAGHCDALYRSTGDTYVNSPGQQIAHSTWAPVEQADFMTHALTFQFNRVGWNGPSQPLLAYGGTTLLLRPLPDNMAFLQVVHAGAPGMTWPSSTGYPFPQILHGLYRITVTTDPYLQSIVVGWYGSTMIDRFLAGSGPAHVVATPSADEATSPVTVSEIHQPRPDMSICTQLLAAKG